MRPVGKVRPLESKSAAREVFLNSKHIALETLKRKYFVVKAFNEILIQ